MSPFNEDIAQDLARILQQSDRARSIPGGVEVRTDDGQWVSIDQGNTVQQDQLVRYRRRRGTPTPRTYPILYMLDTYLGGSIQRKELVLDSGTFAASAILKSPTQFTINGRYYYTTFDSFSIISGTDEYWRLYVAPIGSVWLGAQILEDTTIIDPITGEVDATTPWESYFIDEDIMTTLTGSVHRVTENNNDPVTGAAPPNRVFSETASGSLQVRLMLDRVETNSGTYAMNGQDDTVADYGFQVINSNTEFWDTLLVDETKQRGFICHCTATYYKRDEASDGVILDRTETVETTQELFLLDNGIEKACNTESVFLSDTTTDATRTALEVEPIGVINTTLTIPVPTSIDGPVPDSFQPANILGRSVIFAFRINNADLSDFRVRRAYGQITGSESLEISSGLQYASITVNFTLLEEVDFDSRTESGNGTLYSDSRSVLNFFMRGTNFFTFQDWIDLSDFAQRLAWRVGTSFFMSAAQGSYVNGGCLTWGTGNTIYAPNISPFAGVLDENYIEVYLIKEEGGLVHLERQREVLTVSQIPYADSIDTIPIEVVAARVTL